MNAGLDTYFHTEAIMSEQAYLNGRLVNLREAAVDVTNPSLLHGVGLFETLRVYRGRPFRLAQHVERMKASAGRLSMPLGRAIEQIAGAVEMVLEANGLQDARVRFTVTPPSSPDHPDETTLLVTAQQITGYPKELYEKGMTVFICNDYRQSSHDPLAGHKTTSYFPRLIALRDAQAHQCGEALWFTPDNLLAEGCISNVFMVKDGQLRTPPLNTPVLPGITRAVVLELARADGIPTEESPCTINTLLDADEVFLTNAIMEIMPVTRVERRSIADEKPGPVTRRLAGVYRDLTEA